MNISSKYDPGSAEDKWYKWWMEQGLFKSEPDDREPYVITIPPPNVTGVLHMGHMLNNTIQDVLVRRERMNGKNVCWVPGTDHASIATEAKVVAKLKSEGIEKSSLTRDEFLQHAWEWTDKHGGIILEQLKRLGASCDWDRTLFTMDDTRYRSVIKVFVDLYSKGLVYRGVRMINWDPQAGTAVSDEEVIHSEEDSLLYYVDYRIVGEEEGSPASAGKVVTIATTRPETILGDTAVCINPADERFTYLKGKSVIVPMVNRKVPVIFDDYVDPEFGTGCLKVTPAHDINDYEIGLRHNLQVIDIFNDDGTLSKEAGLFVGTDRFEARDLALAELEKSGALSRTEEYKNKVGRSERTNAVIEPKLSMQWFLKMDKLSKPALDAVINGDVNIHPPKYKNVYRHWMENVRDWCVSRQLWWGQRIPAYYYSDTGFVVAESAEKALEMAKSESGDPDLKSEDLRQDEDVLDTWFSSWLWPITSFNGILEPGNRDIKYYYPTDALITAPEILFFWVARMIISGYEYMGEKPFSDVYLHGLVRDKQRRKMSKSLGNSPDPIDLIKKYGADGVRVGMLLCSPAGNDLLYDDSLPEQGRNFANKIWNAFRLIKSWEVDDNINQPVWSERAGKAFDTKLSEAVIAYNKDFKKFRISSALMIVYRLFWDEFSSWYLEIIKPDYQKPVDRATYNKAISYFDSLMRLIHPFMPFITEEIWQLISERGKSESIMTTSQPVPGKADGKTMREYEEAKQVISLVRNVRKEKSIKNRESLDLFFREGTDVGLGFFSPMIIRLGNIGNFSAVNDKPDGAVSLIVGTIEYYIPVGDKMDIEAEVKKLNTDLNYYQGFLRSVMKKLENERFINNAPGDVVASEKKKGADTEAKIMVLKKRLKELTGLV
ncbi:MAG: valine--tRNA ligase [Bacteroidales bacterium]|nr:valine--tRNA ligase [Bacteroidales bacterium]